MIQVIVIFTLHLEQSYIYKSKYMKKIGNDITCENEKTYENVEEKY